MSHVKKNSFLLYIIPLMLVSLACGVSTQLPQKAKNDTALMPETSTPVNSVEMVVTGDLYIRAMPGEKQPLVDGKHILHTGDVVTCYTMYTGADVGDGLWCLHELGWSNARWLEVR